jgi:hypothetical protein
MRMYCIHLLKRPYPRGVLDSENAVRMQSELCKGMPLKRFVVRWSEHPEDNKSERSAVRSRPRTAEERRQQCMISPLANRSQEREQGYRLRYCCRNTITQPRPVTVPYMLVTPLPHSLTPFPVKSPAGSWGDGPATPLTGRKAR